MDSRARSVDRRSPRFCRALALVLLAAVSGCASRTAPLQREAVRLYDEERYAEARPLLEQIDAAGRASGPLLYRLHYCEQMTGDADAARRTLERAVAALERELPKAKGLEVPFYLVSAYNSLGRAADAQRVAGETTGRVEAGRLPEPGSALDRFRLGKLYADQGQSEGAIRWYSLAVEGPEALPPGPYVRWASRYLAEPAYARGDYAAAARFYGHVAAGEEASAADLQRLAVALLRSGSFGQAADAWERAAKVDQDDPDRMRYCSRLAALAADAGTLAGTAPDGRGWSELGKDELHAILVEQAQAARAAIDEAKTAVDDPERLAALEARLGGIQPVFAAAGLEYAIRGFGIREAAFFGGYARLIFHKRDWHVVPRQRKPRAG